ncbi:MAG: hypothetical protein HYY44_05000 [Deltaproteobacteria bacterium]|nr:hypothetical protein [Deltaproteobacteria bacterium]
MEKPQFTQYPHIENIEDVPALFDLPEVIVTEKIHGSAMRLGVIGNQLRLGGRKYEFEDRNPLSKDGQGFVSWVLDTGLDKKMLEVFSGHDVIFYGEWHGLGTPRKGWPQIQKGIRYIQGNDFRVFDVKVDGRYLPQDEIAGWAARVGLRTVPVLYRGKPVMDLFDSLIDTESRLAQENGIHDPANTLEGLVIRPPEFVWDEKRNPVMAKYKIGKWAERASALKHPNQMKKSRESLPAPAGAREFAEEFVTRARLGHIFDSLREEGLPVEKGSLGEVMKRMGQDIKREGAKTLEQARLEWKDASPFVSRLVKDLFLNYLRENDSRASTLTQRSRKP